MFCCCLSVDCMLTPCLLCN